MKFQMKSANYKKYDIIAVMPTSKAAFQFTCSNIEADILTFNPENKANFSINRKMYMLLVEKGYHYEILYSPAIQDSTARKNLIHQSHVYHSVGKSKNIIISSGATNSILLRSPYDIINLLVPSFFIINVILFFCILYSIKGNIFGCYQLYIPLISDNRLTFSMLSEQGIDIRLE